MCVCVGDASPAKEFRPFTFHEIPPRYCRDPPRKEFKDPFAGDVCVLALATLSHMKSGHGGNTKTASRAPTTECARLSRHPSVGPPAGRAHPPRKEFKDSFAGDASPYLPSPVVLAQESPALWAVCVGCVGRQLLLGFWEGPGALRTGRRCRARACRTVVLLQAAIVHLRRARWPLRASSS